MCGKSKQSHDNERTVSVTALRDELTEWHEDIELRLVDVEARATVLPEVQAAFFRGAREAYRSVMRLLDEMEPPNA